MNTYVIFGATGDIGIEYIKHLDIKGSHDLVIAFGNNNIKRIEELNTQNINLVPVKCDLTDIEQTDNTLRNIVKQYNNISHFINFAYSKLKYDRVVTFSPQDIETAFRIQISSCGIALKHIIPIMKKNKFGRIIITTSSAIIGTPSTFMSEYTIIKYAALGMIKTYAAECIKYGITVNGIAPSMVQTKLWDELPPLLTEMNLKNHPLKRAVRFEEINACLNYLASADAEFTTGTNINISGGEII